MSADAEALAALARLFHAFPGADVVEGLDLGSAALEYASCGWEVFPLGPRSKVPALRGHGFHDATTDLIAVARWWEANPSFNIGARVPRGVFVLDIDPRNGGDVNIAELERANGPLPPTLTCITGREDGGQHRYYRAPAGPMRATLCPGVDVKTHDTGYVVLPPSLHPDTGRPYRWAEVDAPIAGMTNAASVRKPRPQARQHAPIAPTASGYVRAALANEVAAVVAATPGERNHQLNRSAFNLGQLVAGGALEADDVTAALVHAAHLAGLESREIESTIASGLRAGAEHPRGKP